MDEDTCVPLRPRPGRPAACTNKGSWRKQQLKAQFNAQDLGVPEEYPSVRIIPKAAFGENTVEKTYRFQLTVTDFLGNPSAVFTKRLDGLAGLKPAVTLAEYTSDIYYNSTVALSADASLPTCLMTEV